MSTIEKDINQVVLFQLDRTNKLAKQCTQREFDALNLGITVEQWIILKIVQEAKALSQKELAEKSLRDPASITRTLDLLQKKDLIQRMSITDNRRQYEISLTPQGVKFVKANMELVHAQRLKSTAGFSKKEITTLRDLLLRMQQNMR
jgi:MarR family transcriptional regulator for hemolysin